MILSLQSLLGIVTFVALAWLLSERRSAIPWRVVTGGLLLQFALAAVLLLPATSPSYIGVKAIWLM